MRSRNRGAALTASHKHFIHTLKEVSAETLHPPAQCGVVPVENAMRVTAYQASDILSIDILSS